MTKEEQKQALGKLSEDLVAVLAKKKGSKVEMATDPYDGEKDMVINGKKTEVKFQTPFFNFTSPVIKGTVAAFTVPISGKDKVSSNQLNKCLQADEWVIVRNPCAGQTDRKIRIYMAPPVGQRTFSISQTRDGRVIAGFPMDQFRLVKELDNEKLYAEFAKYNMTKYETPQNDRKKKEKDIEL